MSENPETETGVAFAAGVATAQAAQAEDTAAVAEIRAEGAQAIAEEAHERAAAAEDTAWDARAAVGALESRFEEGLAEIRELISPKTGDNGGGRPATGEPAPEPGAVPAPERKEGESTAVVETVAKKPKRSGYGSRSWFGN